MTDGLQGMKRQGMNMQSRSFKLLQAAMLTGAANIAIVGSAQAEEQVMSFNMPDQSLSAALKSYALKTGKNLVYPPKMVANKRAKAVSGRHTPTQALRLLLRGTSISFREIQPNIVALTVISKARLRQNTVTPPTASPAVVQSTSTAATVQNDVGIDDGATGAVSGTVVNQNTGSALSGALVSIDGTNLEAVTDDRGQYFFPAVPRGQQVVRVEYLGEPAETVIISVAVGSRQQANIQLGQANQDIVVFGYRSSIQQALNKQKNADNNATVVSSDLLGGFPAETVSEALRRVPGVAFGRDDATGEGSRITVRGFSSEAINVQLNGLDLQGTGFDRTIDLSGFLTDNISEIRIQKTLLPSHEATGSGGLVEIETKSGLDYGDFSFNVSFEGEQNLKSRFGDEFQANGTIAKKITDNFGVAATLQYRKTDRLNYNTSVTDIIPAVLPDGFRSIFNVPASFEFPFDPDIEPQLVFGASYVQRDRSEENVVGSINLAWDIADHTKLRLDLQRNIRDAQTLTSTASVGFLLSSVEMPIPELDGDVRLRRTLSSLRPNVILNTTDEKVTTSTISFRGDTEIDRWNFKYKLGYSRAVRKGSNSVITSLGTANPAIIDLIDPSTIVLNPDDDANQTPRVVNGVFAYADNGLPIPSLSPAGISYLLDNSNYNVSSASRTLIDDPTDSYVGEFSARYDTPLNFLNYVELGFKYDSRKRTTLDNTLNSASSRSSTFTRISGRDTSLSQLDGGSFVNRDLGIIGIPGVSIPLLTKNSSDRIFDDLFNFTADDPSTPDFDEERFRFTNLLDLDPVLDGGAALLPTKTTEDKLAGYLETKFELGDLDLIAGVRYEREKREASTISIPTIILNEPGRVTVPRDLLVSAGLVNFNATGGIAESWTPSFLLTYRPIDSVTARLGYFRSTVHPSLQLLNRSTVYTADFRETGVFGPNITILEANPGLKPTITDNLDLDIAYYFDDTPGLVRFGLFYKAISNNFTNVITTTGIPDGQVRDRYVEFFEPISDSVPEAFEFPDDMQFFLARPENGEGGKIWGAEFEIIRRLNFLPGFLSDFGVLANVTYTNGDFPTLVTARDDDGEVIQLSLDRSLRDQARWVYNLSLDYERDGFQGRVIYTRQSTTAEAFDEFNLNTVTPAFATLDARFSYNFEKFGGLWTIFLEGDDLLTGSKEADIRSATSSQFGDGDASFFYPQNFQFNGGRTVTMGIRAKF